MIGNGGGGKSTLARALGERLDIPVHEVDAVQWRPGWERASLDETALILERWAAGEAWAGQQRPPDSLLLFRTPPLAGRDALVARLRRGAGPPFVVTTDGPNMGLSEVKACATC